jgi:hypothetical protein
MVGYVSVKTWVQKWKKNAFRFLMIGLKVHEDINKYMLVPSH